LFDVTEHFLLLADVRQLPSLTTHVLLVACLLFYRRTFLQQRWSLLVDS